MAIALEAVDLVAICVCLVAIALLTLLLVVLSPVFKVINATVGRLPGVGGITRAVQNAVLAGLQDAIDANGRAVTWLWHGLQWSAELTAEAVHVVAALTHQALDYLAHTTFGHTIQTLIRPVQEVATDAHAIAVQAETDIGHLSDYLGGRVATVEHAVTVDLPAKIVHETDRVGLALGAIAGQILDELQRDLDRQGRQLGDVISQVEHGLQAQIGRIPLQDLLGLLAAFPAIALLVQAIATEAGLDNAACRGKVKNICAVDPLRWERLLFGLAAIGSVPSLRELVEFAGETAGAAANLARDLATA